MKQRTREGSYFRLNEAAEPEAAAVLLEEWLLAQVLEPPRRLAA
jgi:hypothetical protein